jgi:hypothetical protein
MRSRKLPKNKVALNAVYTWTMDAGSLSPSVSYFWRDSQYGSIFQRSYNKAPSYDQVDLRLTWKTPRTATRSSATPRTVFDDLGYYEGSTSTRLVGPPSEWFPGVQGHRHDLRPDPAAHLRRGAAVPLLGTFGTPKWEGRARKGAPFSMLAPFPLRHRICLGI